MLPFEKDNNKRKYRCFVCGVDYETQEEYSSHIKEEHEEGREYILCKVCNSPVRDLIMHFKALHPQLPRPKGQIKALIWKDFGGRNKKNKKPSFRSGDFISAKNGGKLMHYRSGWECKCYELLEEWNDIIKYDAEPFSIPYIWNGEQHMYKPDLILEYIDGRREVWEIKPSNQTAIDQNKAKWHAAKEYCYQRDWDFMVLTEKGIEKLKIKILNENF